MVTISTAQAGWVALSVVGLQANAALVAFALLLALELAGLSLAERRPAHRGIPTTSPSGTACS
jgi:hypothetical protein